MGVSGRKVGVWLASEAADHPKEQAEENADKNGTCERNRDAPTSAAPGEIARQPTEGNVEPIQQNKGDANGDKEKAEKDEDAAEVLHGISAAKRD